MQDRDWPGAFGVKLINSLSGVHVMRNLLGTVVALSTGLLGCVAGAGATPEGTEQAQLSETDTSTAAVTFAVRFEGISDSKAIVLPDGTTTAAPISPGMLAVGFNDNTLFKTGALATNPGLQQLAEDGNPSPLIVRTGLLSGVTASNYILPNFHYRISARPGEKLFFAMMFVQSNDLFYSFGSKGLALFDDLHQPISGDVSAQVQLWDAGSEQNQGPAIGPDQAPRQIDAGVGTKTRDGVKLLSDVHDGFAYPDTLKVIRVTITPNP
jgi:hypothetical protein